MSFSAAAQSTPEAFPGRVCRACWKIAAGEALQRILLEMLGDVNLPQGIPCNSQAAQSRRLGIHSNFLCFFNLTLTSLTDGERWLNRGSLQKFVLWCLQTVSVRSIFSNVNTAMAGCRVPLQQLILLSLRLLMRGVPGQLGLHWGTERKPALGLRGVRVRPSLLVALHREHEAKQLWLLRPDWIYHLGSVAFYVRGPGVRCGRLD